MKGMSPRRRASHKYPLQLSHFCSAGFAQRLRPPILAVGDWLEAWVGKCWAYTLGQRRLTPGITQTDRGFTGQQSLSAAGLVDFNARWVDSSLGVFASPDSFISNLFTPQALNRYGYVLNNPLRYRDPTGAMFTEIGPGEGGDIPRLWAPEETSTRETIRTELRWLAVDEATFQEEMSKYIEQEFLNEWNTPL